MLSKEEFLKRLHAKGYNRDVDILGEYNGSDYPIDCKCNVCGYAWSPIAQYLYKNIGCPVCANKIIVKGVNDLWTTHPQLAKFLKNKEDGYKHTYGSAKKLEWTCPNCKNIVFHSVNKVVKFNKIVCHACSDNTSMANRIMYNLLLNMNVDFVSEKSFIWGKNKKGNKYYYDFYIPFKNIIIEMHGRQHYLLPFNDKSRTVDEEQANDNAKRELSILNGFTEDKYITIDARNSDYEFIKNNIISSHLTKHFCFDSIDWDKVFTDSSSSRVVDVANLWNSGYSPKEIAKKIKASKSGITVLLKKASFSGLCDYSPELALNKLYESSSKKVICLETKEVYDSVESCGKHFEVSPISISNVCNITDSSKEKLRTVKKKHFLFYDDFINMSDDEIVNILMIPPVTKSKSFYCIEENRIFTSVQEIHIWCGVSHMQVQRFFEGKVNYAGFHPITKDRLHWRNVTKEDIAKKYDYKLKELKYA